MIAKPAVSLAISPREIDKFLDLIGVHIEAHREIATVPVCSQSGRVLTLVPIRKGEYLRGGGARDFLRQTRITYEEFSRLVAGQWPVVDFLAVLERRAV